MLSVGLTRGVSPNTFTFHGMQLGSPCTISFFTTIISTITLAIFTTIVVKLRLQSMFPTQGPWSCQKPGSDVSHGTDLFCSERGVGKHGVRQKQAPRAFFVFQPSAQQACRLLNCHADIVWYGTAALAAFAPPVVPVAGLPACSAGFRCSVSEGQCVDWPMKPAFSAF